MAISSLATVKQLSPNHSGKRIKPIDTFTYHCFVGQVTATRGLQVFQPTSKQASCNYVIGYDGSIGACVDEDNRSWCTSSSANDQRAVTFELASESYHPYGIRDACYDATKRLSIDIMKRLGKSKIIYIKDKDAALVYTPKPSEIIVTEHRWFANKACPGDHIRSILPDLCDAINRELAADDVLYQPIYRVQIGAFSNKSNAQNMLEIVKAAGYDAYINNSDQYYRVQVGAYKVKSNAQNMLAKIKADGFEVYLKESVA